LAQWLLGWDAARLLTSAHEEAPPTFPAQHGALVARRAGREPMAYLLGRQEFWGLMFDVTPAVLIPRPETELIVEIALELFPDRDVPLQIADIGTGSGCLAAALAIERPRARITASDVSAAALLVASNNAARHGVDGRITFIEGELFSPMPARPAFNLIVSNPPYVPTSDLSALQTEVREHEPAVALLGGPDGLDVIRPLVAQSVERLTPDGALIFEFGMGQADAIRELISSTNGLRMIDLRRDLQGIPRTAVAQRI